MKEEYLRRLILLNVRGFARLELNFQLDLYILVYDFYCRYRFDFFPLLKNYPRIFSFKKLSTYLK